jgi:hypothetical protein
LPDLFDYIFSHVLKTPQTLPGVGKLFAETVRGIQKQFHSCTENVVTILLSKFAPDVEFDLDQGSKVRTCKLFAHLYCVSTQINASKDVTFQILP